MFILYFALWVILNGKWTTEIGLFGLAFAAIAYVFSCRFMGYKLSLDFALLRRVPSAISYGCMLLGEIVKSNLTVIRMILDRDFEPQPHLVQFDADLKKDRHRVALANSITLTPGTITVSLEGSHYVVHCLDKSMIDGLDNGAMVSMLTGMEKKHLAQDARRAEAKAAQAAAAEEKAAQQKAAEEAAQAQEAALQAEAAPETEQAAEPETEPEAAAEAAAEAVTQEEAKEDGHEH